jgi:hypothetical protein
MTATTTRKPAAASPSPKKAITKATPKKAVASPKKKAESPKKAPAPAPDSPKKSPSPPPKAASPAKRKAGETSVKPKKAATAYFIWLNEVGRKKIIAEKFGGSGSNVAAISKEAGVLWGKMSEADKKPFQAKADKDKARYAKEMESYVPSEDDEPKKKKGKKGKKEKDPNKPKKPVTPYMAWLTENRAEIAKDPAVKVNTDVMRVAGQKWAVLPAAAKAKYETIAAEAKKKYDVAIEAYKASKGDDDDDDDEE